MASIVARGGKVWQVNVRHTEPGGTQRTRWHTLPETVKNKKQALAAVANLHLAAGETAPLSTVREHDNTSYFVKWDVVVDGKKKQRWHKLAGVVDAGEASAKRYEIEKRIASGEDPFPMAAPTATPESMAVLMRRWSAALTNRNGKNDRSIVENHLIPRFGALVPGQINSFAVIAWLDELKAEARLSSQTQRHLLGALSRFFSWLSERMRIENPVRAISKASRPKVVHERRAWLEDESLVPKLMAALEKQQRPLALMFALGNRSGLRLGEIAGLRMSDLDHLTEGFITASHSYDGPLKEDRGTDAVHRTKTVPAPVGAEKVLGPHLKERRAEGAGSEDPVFLPPSPKWTRIIRRRAWPGYTKEAVNYHWRKACAAVGLVDKNGRPTVTWYGATRHSAASRAKKAGLLPEQIAESLGHRNTDMVRRFYFGQGTERRDFDRALRLAIPVKRRAS